jgi:hypothetical protein
MIFYTFSLLRIPRKLTICAASLLGGGTNRPGSAFGSKKKRKSTAKRNINFPGDSLR